jgi:hypothetical protein
VQDVEIWKVKVPVTIPEITAKRERIVWVATKVVNGASILECVVEEICHLIDQIFLAQIDIKVTRVPRLSCHHDRNPLKAT